MTKSKFGVYIIESLRDEDYLDGLVLSEILELSKIPVTYKFVANRIEFLSTLQSFKESNLRYLHLSCHADEEGIQLSDDDCIDNDVLEICFKGILEKRRLFLSTCKGANRDLAIRVIKNNKAISLVGTPTGFKFVKSALFWPTFYHVIGEIDKNKMTKDNITDVLKKCVDIYNVPINYYTKIINDTQHIWRRQFRKDVHTDSRRIKATLKK